MANLLIVETWQADSSTGDTYGWKNFCYHGDPLFSSPHLLDFNMLGIFSSKNVKMRPQTRPNIFTCLLDNAYQVSFANMKIEHQRRPEMSLILGRSGSQDEAFSKCPLSPLDQTSLQEHVFKVVKNHKPSGYVDRQHATAQSDQLSKICFFCKLKLLILRW